MPRPSLVETRGDTNARFPDRIHLLRDLDLLDPSEVFLGRATLAEPGTETRGTHQVLGTRIDSPTVSVSVRLSRSVLASAMCQNRVASPYCESAITSSRSPHCTL